MGVTNFPCRYPSKQYYSTRVDAKQGAREIKRSVESEGGVYDQLYPYRCPDGNHWHLSHFQQGVKTCPRCGNPAPAWNGGDTWVIGFHKQWNGEKCYGESLRVP